VTVQLGWHRLYQLSADLTGNVDRVPIDPPGPTTSVSRDNRLTGDIDLFSAAAAVKLTSRLAVGGNVDFWRGQWVDRLTLVEEATGDGPPPSLANSSRNTMRGRGLTAGVLLTYPSWNVGLVYHAPFWSSLHVRGQVTASRIPTQHVESDAPRFRLPRNMGGGIARRFGPRWTVAATLTHDQWTDALLDHVPGEAGAVNFFDGAPPALSTTRDTVSVNVGVEHLLFREGSVVPLRAGFGWEPQGAMDPFTRDPVNYLLMCGGTGYNTNRFKFDAAVQYRRGTFRTSDVFSVDTILRGHSRDAEGRAQIGEWRVKVSAIYRLADTEKLRAGLRRIFG
jgi:hypothetical protein